MSKAWRFCFEKMEQIFTQRYFCRILAFEKSGGKMHLAETENPN
ncbi:MAG: hypothetical protein U5L10_03115 [Candidatus Moranbacteria bacterium]|nr:hypothetical protein [Candidatus Moranbacteria bacterium]